MKMLEAWQSLVHVCRRWRYLVFGSPRRLNLQLLCTAKTPARDTLDVWQALPLLILGYMFLSSGVDNIIVALGQTNRVCQVDLRDLGDRQVDKVSRAMQVPFPQLTELRLFSNGETPPVVPDSFLGGSAPLLRHSELWGIPFPGLPMHLSATHLVTLCFLISLIPGTFCQRQWPLSSPCCPASKNFTFHSNTLNLALTG